MVCINPAYRLFELEYALNKVGCKAIVSAEVFKTSRYLAMLQELAPELGECEPGEPPLSQATPPGHRDPHGRDGDARHVQLRGGMRDGR